MSLRLLLLLFLLSIYAEAAKVDSLKCLDIDTEGYLMRPFEVEAFYNDANLTLQFNTRILADISDVNTTTNRYTTGHAVLYFKGRLIRDHYFRLCDYLQVKERRVVTPTSSSFGPINTNGPVIVGRDSESCPLFPDDEVTINYIFSVPAHDSLGSYTARISIISNTESQDVIGCAKTYVTPEQCSSLIRAVYIMIPIMAALIALVSDVSLAFSPYQESDSPFLYLASSICNAPLLRQITPTVSDFFVYIQYALFLGSLDAFYPGFLQPLLSSIKWTALIVNVSDNPIRISSSTQDGVYIGGNQILGPNTLKWPTWVILFCCVVVGRTLFVQAWFIILRFTKRRASGSSFYHNALFCLGFAVQLFLVTFARPFLVVTIALCFARSPEKWSIIAGSITLALWVALVGTFLVKYVFSSTRSRLYSSLESICIWCSLYYRLDPEKLHFTILEFSELIIFGIFVGALKNQGTVQIIGLIILQSLNLVAFLICRPHYVESKFNYATLTMILVKTLVAFLNIAFLGSLTISDSTRSKVVYAQLFLHLFVLVVVFLVPTLLNLVNLIKSIRLNQKGLLDGHDRKYEKLSNFPFTTSDSTASRDPDMRQFFESPAYQQSFFRQATSSQPPQAVHRRSTPEAVPEWPQREGIDYAVREADAFINAHRILEPDPEVKRLWEARNEKINSVPSSTLVEKRRWWIKKEKEPVKRGFEVMNRKPLITQRESDLSSEFLRSKQELERVYTKDGGS